MNPMIEILERRAKQVRSRAAIRRWEYRQRHHSKGVWVRLTRLLADMSYAWDIDEAFAEQLIAQGHEPEAVGLELQPTKTLLVLTADAPDPSPEVARPLEINLGAKFLAARYVALRRFPRLERADGAT